MMNAVAIAGVLLSILSINANGCRVVDVTSISIGNHRFHQIPLNDDNLHIINTIGNGRPVYFSETNDINTVEIYLYHVSSNDNGRWIINDRLGSEDSALSYIDSWAVTPYLTYALSDTNKTWRTVHKDTQEWTDIDDVTVQCSRDDVYDEVDHTIYFDASRLSPINLSGFYVERVVDDQSTVVYTHVNSNRDDTALMLHQYESKWIISENVTSSEGGVAFIDNNNTYPYEKTGTNNRWRYSVLSDDGSNAFVWIEDDGYIYSGHDVDAPEAFDVYDSYFYQRTIKYIPTGQQFIQLRNKIILPTIGLGTGGIYLDRMKDVVTSAMSAGYRLFDLAREYNNEHLLSDVLQQNDAVEDTAAAIPRRDEIFLETKVWPTHLGFAPTDSEIDQSLASMSTNYIDLYLIHWPQCDSNVDWMHCDTTIDPDGTWQESWAALEKAYAEGKVVSIGVSNFNIDQLNELKSFANTLPHVIQNWSEPGSMDVDVRRWCTANSVIYQPYASIRNLSSLPDATKATLRRIAAEKGTSEHVIALSFFIQTGASIIPRATSVDHLHANIKASEYTLTQEELAELGWVVADQEL